MMLNEKLAALETSTVPTWVFDADFFRQRWANQAALELWSAASKEELYARDYSDMSESTRARMRGYIEGFRSGRNAEEQWTLYPKGKPLTVKLFLSGIALDDGRIGVLIQAFEKEPAASADLVRSVEVLRHASSMLTVLAEDGTIVFQNPAAIAAFGLLAEFKKRFTDETIPSSLVETVRNNEVFATEMPIMTNDGSRWHVVKARRMHDPTTGTKVILVEHTDETVRRQAEKRAEVEAQLGAQLRATLTLVEKQKTEILSLVAPIIEVSEKTIAVPLIGILNPERAEALEERLLQTIAERGTSWVILDLTGADDAAMAGLAEHIERLARAIRLLGARTMMSGISSSLARAFISSGITMTDSVLVAQSLRQAMAVIERRRD